jgi:hypothetical protein
MASLQVDASTPNFMIQEGGITLWFQEAVIGDFPIQKDGYLPVPTAPVSMLTWTINGSRHIPRRKAMRRYPRNPYTPPSQRRRCRERPGPKTAIEYGEDPGFSVVERD